VRPILHVCWSYPTSPLLRSCTFQNQHILGWSEGMMVSTGREMTLDPSVKGGSCQERHSWRPPAHHLPRGRVAPRPQMHAVTRHRRGVMSLGPAGSGKTTARSCLQVSPGTSFRPPHVFCSLRLHNHRIPPPPLNCIQTIKIQSSIYVFVWHHNNLPAMPYCFVGSRSPGLGCSKRSSPPAGRPSSLWSTA